ncbi:CTR2 long splice variant [Sodiomyces alkalinus F11]|uniref:Copper transport protein n=1 Tax=Sodiomyces alkalinus (strain CBS 110278 / VKM F-3762 / F11) TaxID=1314773 RepID=A0A3N2PQU2_SODAK|nr:CTR2 long splice variant [Sodiomyces alkalinus F11]ROT36883.1 CTR2 long splice variant [Sodiomyces alkalinus F11]
MDHHDHSQMHTSDMDHGHGGHGDMGGSDQCSMSMLFTWDTNNLCIVFRQWHIRSTSSLLFSLLLVVALTAGYEALRAASRRYETKVNKKVESLPTDHRGDAPTESTPFLWTGQQQIEATKTAHIIKAALYALQNFYAFMIMLIFMTYNGWVMIAVAVGAFVGYVLFGNSISSTKDNACH